MLSQNKILKVLSTINDPELQRSLTELKMVRSVKVQDGRVLISLALAVKDSQTKDQIEAEIRAKLKSHLDGERVTIESIAMPEDERKLLLSQYIEGSAAERNRVHRVIAVMSGKGGVGKSLVTGLLASALAQEGYQVGILDADITGPSIPKLFGLSGTAASTPDGLQPEETATGVKVMSFNLLLAAEDQPIIWRGPLIGRAITQLWTDVQWGSLDYLLVDLPPGTADASLTTLQSLPVSGILMVTMPQSLSAMIVRKAVHMTQMIGVPILGVIENMSYFVCPDTGTHHEVFGPSHAETVAELAGAPVLARLPINPLISQLCDAGKIEAVRLSEAHEMVQAFLREVQFPDTSLPAPELTAL